MLLRSGFQSLNKPALELSKRPALIFAARGASPLMRERRINGYYDALFGRKLQGSLTKSPVLHRSDNPGGPQVALAHSLSRPIDGDFVAANNTSMYNVGPRKTEPPAFSSTKERL